MPPYLTDLQQVQVGKETTWGTPVNTTAKLMGCNSFEIDPILLATLLNDSRGSRSVGVIPVLTDQGATAKFSGDANYEDILYFIESLLGTVAQTGAGPYTRNYADFLTALPTYRPQTFVYGQTGIPVQINGAIVDTLSLSGDANTTLKYSGTMFGKSAQVGTLQALSDRVINPIMGAHATMYMDAWGGTMQSTALVTSAYKWQLALTANRNRRKFVGSGLTAGDWNDTTFKADLTLSVEVNATTNAWLTTLLGGSLLQLLWAINFTVGAGASLKQFALQMPITVPAAPALYTDNAGIVSFDLKGSMSYQSTFANQLKIISQNGNSAIP